MKPKYFCIPSQSYFTIVWMGPNWVQTICRALWMCYLAETSFFFLLLSLFSVLFCRKVMAQQWSVLSGFTQLHTASLPSFVCVCALETCAQLNMYYMNATKHCVCACLCVCAWACLYLVPLCLTRCLCNPPHPPPYWCQGASIRRNFPRGYNWSHA